MSGLSVTYLVLPKLIHLIIPSMLSKLNKVLISKSTLRKLKKFVY